MPTTDGNSQQASLKYFNNFLLFTEDLLRYHKQMTFEFDKVHSELANNMISNRYTLTILPRGHLKTTFLNCYALWKPNMRLLWFQALLICQ